MNYWQARSKAEVEYKKAVKALKANDTQRNRDRLRIKKALFEGLQRNYRGGEM